MTNVTLKGLPAGNAELHYAARVEPYRQGLLPRPAALVTTAVDANGNVTFDMAPRVPYVVFDAQGKPHTAMDGGLYRILSLDPATIVAQAPLITLRVLGWGFSSSSRIVYAGEYARDTDYIGQSELQYPRLSVANVGTFAVSVENAGVHTNTVNLTVTAV